MSHFRDFWQTKKGNMAFIDGNITSMYYLNSVEETRKLFAQVTRVPSS
jgi:hypothetical protein